MMLAYLAIAFLVLTTAYSGLVAFREKPAPEKSSWIFPSRAGRWGRLLVGIVTLIFFVAIGIAVWPVVAARNQTGHSLRFLVPQGYTGWVRVEFEVGGAPRLPVESDQAIARVSADGKLATSSPEIYAFAKDYFFSYSGTNEVELPHSGPQRMIWGKINGQSSAASGARKYEEFFVGTEPQYREQLENRRTATPR
ncbi:MAG TPA: hypothetical protein VND65_12750 [Candidatus Binatia bacterium]|nr:hypothetical protein [Candidatus Binatia bacterium]